MVDDPRFNTPEQRVIHRNELEQLFQEKLMEATAEEWLEIMNRESVVCAPVNTLDKAASDPQVKHRNMVIEIEHALGGKIKLIGNPVKMPGSIDDSEYMSPPTHGQHNYEVFGELLGYSKEKIAQLLEEGKNHIGELTSHLHKRHQL